MITTRGSTLLIGFIDKDDRTYEDYNKLLSSFAQGSLTRATVAERLQHALPQSYQGRALEVHLSDGPESSAREIADTLSNHTGSSSTVYVASDLALFGSGLIDEAFAKKHCTYLPWFQPLDYFVYLYYKRSGCSVYLEPLRAVYISQIHHVHFAVLEALLQLRGDRLGQVIQDATANVREAAEDARASNASAPAKAAVVSRQLDGIQEIGKLRDERRRLLNERYEEGRASTEPR